MLCAVALLVLGGCSREAATPPAATGAPDPVAQVDWGAMKAFWDRSIGLPGIETGPPETGKRMLVYFDPNCPVCARQWRILQPYLGAVRIRWIPIAYMSESSKRRAAAILAAPDPVRALAQNEDEYDDERHLGGYPPSASVPDWALRAVETNTRQAMRAGDATGTPTLGFELYKGERYFRLFGLLGERAAAVAVKELGDTRDPWARTRELTSSQAAGHGGGNPATAQ